MGVVMTWAKTVLYWLVDFYCGPEGWCTSRQNDTRTWIVLYAFPNVSPNFADDDFNAERPSVTLRFWVQGYATYLHSSCD